MLSHIVSDLHNAYLEEVFKPQLGKPGASTPTPKKPVSSSDLNADGNVDSFEEKVRQLIYDVRHIMKEKKVPAEQAFKIKVATAKKYGPEAIKSAKEKLGIKTAVATPVSEENSERMVRATINFVNGTIDRRNVPYSEVAALRKKPTVRSVEISSNKPVYPGAGEKYEKKYSSSGENTIGDKDGDGTKEPDSHEYAGVKDIAIKKAMFRNKSTNKKRKLRNTYGVAESFSDWRNDLREVVDEIESKKNVEIKEDPKINNKIVINPEFKENYSFELIEENVLSEEYINETANIAAEFFYNCGLNENGVDIVIEELGEDRFVEFIFDLTEEYLLSEERAAKKRTRGKSYEEIKAAIDKKEQARKKITADKTKSAVEKAKKTQVPSAEKPTKQGIAGRIMGALQNRAQKDIEARKQFMSAARETGKTISKAAKHVGGVARKAGEGARGAVKFTGDVAKELTKEELELQEKAESEQQQKLFGLALSVKRGETPRSEASPEVLKIVDTMSEKKIRDFAKTPHSEVPKKKVNEAIAKVRSGSPTRTETTQREIARKQAKQAQDQLGIGEDFDVSTMTPQELQLRKQKASIEKRLSDLRQRTVRQQKPNRPSTSLQRDQNQEL